MPMTPTPTATAAVTPTAARVLVRIPRSPHHAREGVGTGVEPGMAVSDMAYYSPRRSADGRRGLWAGKMDDRCAGGSALAPSDQGKNREPIPRSQYSIRARRDNIGHSRQIVR